MQYLREQKGWWLIRLTIKPKKASEGHTVFKKTFYSHFQYYHVQFLATLPNSNHVREI